MREIIDYILNYFIGAKRRFRSQMSFGKDSYFLPHFSLKMQGKNNSVVIGNECLLGVKLIAEGTDAYFKFGDRVYIGKSQIICRAGIEFEDDILVAWGVTFYDHDSHSLDYQLRNKDLIQQITDYKFHKRNYIKNKNWDVVNTKPIKVCTNAWIGMNAVILKGVTIGEGSIVGACSVVTKDVPPFTVVAGNPAVIIKTLKQ